jgi:rubrerythrin
MHKVNKLRYGQVQNPKKEAGSVEWDQRAHYMQAMYFDETNTVVEHFEMMYRCAQCGNMHADAEYRGGDLAKSHHEQGSPFCFCTM